MFCQTFVKILNCFFVFLLLEVWVANPSQGSVQYNMTMSRDYIIKHWKNKTSTAGIFTCKVLCIAFFEITAKQRHLVGCHTELTRLEFSTTNKFLFWFTQSWTKDQQNKFYSELTLKWACSPLCSLSQPRWPPHTTLGTCQNLLSQSTRLKAKAEYGIITWLDAIGFTWMAVLLPALLEM